MNNPSQQVFQQQQAERQRFQQQLQQVPQAQQQPIPKNALILGLISDALSAGSGSGPGNILNQLKSRTERQFEIDSRKMKLQFDILNKQHEERLSAFDDFFQLQQENRANARESRAAARFPSELKASEANARAAEADATVAEKTVQSRIDQQGLNVKILEEQAAAVKRANQLEQASVQEKRKAEDAARKARIAKSNLEATQAVMLEEKIKSLPDGPERTALLQGRAAPVVLSQTDEEKFFQHEIQTDPEMAAQIRIVGGKFKDLSFANAHKFTNLIANRMDKVEGNIDDVTFQFRERNIQRAYTRQNVDEFDDGTRPDDNPDAFFINPKDEEALWPQMIDDLAKDVVPGVSQYRYMVAHGSDPVDEVKAFFPRQLKMGTGVLVNPNAQKILLTAVNDRRKQLGLPKIDILTPEQATLNQNPQVGFKDIIGLGGQQFLEALGPGQVAGQPSTQTNRFSNRGPRGSGG